MGVDILQSDFLVGEVEPDVVLVPQRVDACTRTWSFHREGFQECTHTHRHTTVLLRPGHVVVLLLRVTPLPFM